MRAPVRRAAAAFAILAMLGIAGVFVMRGRMPSGEKRKSQPALVVQQMGATRLAVRYNRPSARGRPLFGGIVPWDSVWCPGADEGTRLELSRDVVLAGRARLPAGAYTVWMIPRASGDWTLIFSNKSHAYHVPYPGAGHDALRLRIQPRRGAYVESLAFAFPVATPDSAVLQLAWGETVVDVPVRPAPR